MDFRGWEMHSEKEFALLLWVVVGQRTEVAKDVAKRLQRGDARFYTCESVKDPPKAK